MVSVIIPVYNGAEFLEGCLRSVMNQTYRDIEIIVIDDGSTDESYEICQNLQREDPRIRLFTQPNSGVSVARNKGIQEASGQYIMFVDADDFLVDNGIAAIVNSASTGEDFVIGSYQSFRGKYEATTMLENAVYTIDEIKLKFDSFDRLINTPWAKLYKRNIIMDNGIRFSELLPYSEDHTFNLDYVSTITSCRVVDDVVYRYRLGGIASSVRYYPNLNEILLQLLSAYEAFFAATHCEDAGVIAPKAKALFEGAVLHYISNCTFREALRKIEETVVLYGRYIEKRAAINIYCDMFVHNIKQVILRRMKKLYYKLFNKRV